MPSAWMCGSVMVSGSLSAAASEVPLRISPHHRADLRFRNNVSTTSRSDNRPCAQKLPSLITKCCTIRNRALGVTPREPICRRPPVEKDQVWLYQHLLATSIQNSASVASADSTAPSRSFPARKLSQAARRSCLKLVAGEDKATKMAATIAEACGISVPPDAA